MGDERRPVAPRSLDGVALTVAGDAILDRYLDAADSGACREAAAPALAVRSTESVPGGAANAAATVAALGGRPRLLSAMGADAAGAELLRILAARGVGADDVRTGDRPTVVKTRVLRRGSQVLRLDTGTDRAPDRCRGPLDAALAGLTGAHVLISDYGYGALGPDAPSGLARAAPPVLVVDAVELSRWAGAGPTLVTCDEAQATGLLGGVPEGPAAGADLLAATGAAAVVVTLGAGGAILFRPGTRPHHVTVSDPVDGRAPGSGDVLAAAAALCLAAGADVVDAVGFAVRAATLATRLAVERRRTAVFPGSTPPGGDPVPGRAGAVLDPDLPAWAREMHRRGARIVFAGGCFDLLHEGHATLLARARELGDVLLVAVNDDAGVRALKGPGRPVIDLRGRMQLLRALGCVDRVTAFAGTSPAGVLDVVRPHVFVKGGDYSPELLPEAELLARMGVEVRILAFVPDRSTTRLVQRMRTSG